VKTKNGENGSIRELDNYAVNAIDTDFDKMRLDNLIDNHISDHFLPKSVQLIT
jgi:hypothetical protein